MTKLTLVSNRQGHLRPLIEAALANELRLLEAGIRRTEQRLYEFETKYQMATEEFVHRFQADELRETLEFAEWIGEYRLHERLQEKAATLREIEFEN
jgi:hypothetical protein